MKILVDPDSVPMSLEECIDNIKSLLDEDDASEINMFEANPFQREKVGAAIFLKSAWSLSDNDNRLVKWFEKEHGVNHPDDVSNLILHCLYCDIKDIPRNEVETAEKYRNDRNKPKEVKTETKE
jgi:hypothetical protein